VSIRGGIPAPAGSATQCRLAAVSACCEEVEEVTADPTSLRAVPGPARPTMCALSRPVVTGWAQPADCSATIGMVPIGVSLDEIGGVPSTGSGHPR
jgi:hypothetical protein